MVARTNRGAVGMGSPWRAGYSHGILLSSCPKKPGGAAVVLLEALVWVTARLLALGGEYVNGALVSMVFGVNR